MAGDGGTTLMELVVGMTIMAIFMGIFTAAIVNMFSTTNKTQAVVQSSTQLNLAFERLDTQVRYAAYVYPAAVALPVTSPTWSVAFQTDGQTSTTCSVLTISPTSPSDIRNNIVLNDLVEQTWTWNVGSDGTLMAPTGPTQNMLATGVAAVDTAVNPFTVSTPVLGTLSVPQQQVHQQLDLSLIAVDGRDNSLTKSGSEITFSALNSGTPSTARVIPTASGCTPTGTP
jgi:type II secretory pathway pseudopilin PulG